MAAQKLVWDPATGQYVMRNDGSGGSSTTTAPVMGPFAPNVPAGISQAQLAALGLGPQATTTTGAPKKTTTTTGAPAKSTATPPLRPVATVPNTPTTVAPAKPKVQTTGGQSKVGADQMMKTAQNWYKYKTEGAAAGEKDADGDGIPDDEDASPLFNTGGSGGGATKAATNAQNYRQGKQGAQYLLKAAQKAQADYGALGDTAYANMLAGFNPTYDAQIAKLRETLGANQAAGEKQISDAQAALMAQLQPSTVYQNAPVVQLTPEQQALGNALQAYGANDQLAQNANASQTEINRQIADMFRNTNTQLNEANKNYYTGMQNAAAQNAAQAKTNLATNTNTALQQLLGQVEGNRAASVANAEQARQQFQTAGLTAGQQGNIDYANAMAKLIAAYGAPKKKTTKKVK